MNGYWNKVAEYTNVKSNFFQISNKISIANIFIYMIEFIENHLYHNFA